mmetsp:Transcript_33111/g.69281  ORF Transcript_33111/g.69281 Transcript_33111/m.69281 type:complete len:211 (+) Transcript_33111:396-1028(+)
MCKNTKAITCKHCGQLAFLQPALAEPSQSRGAQSFGKQLRSAVQLVPSPLHAVLQVQLHPVHHGRVYYMVRAHRQAHAQDNPHRTPRPRTGARSRLPDRHELPSQRDRTSTRIKLLGRLLDGRVAPSVPPHRVERRRLALRLRRGGPDARRAGAVPRGAERGGGDGRVPARALGQQRAGAARRRARARAVRPQQVLLSAPPRPPPPSPGG